MEAQRGAEALPGDAVAPCSRNALDQARQAQPPQIVGRASGYPGGGVVAQEGRDPGPIWRLLKPRGSRRKVSGAASKARTRGSPKRSAGARSPSR